MKHKPGSRIYDDTQALSLEKGRRVGQPGHNVVRQYLIQRMKEISLDPFSGDSYVLPFEQDTDLSGRQSFYNLVGKVPGSNPSGKKPYLIGAHYDSVIDAPCSDDNATAVAVALAAAEFFMRKPPEADLIIALFDSEEPPWFCTSAMGSIRFYEDHCGDISFESVIILDLIGHRIEIPGHSLLSKIPRIRNMVFALGSESRRTMAFSLEEAAAKVPGLHVFPTLNSYLGDYSDHHAFRLGGEPYVFLSCGQGKFYHDREDNMEWIDFQKVRKVFKLVVQIVQSSERLSDEARIRDHDQAAFEIRMIKRAVRWIYPIALRILKMKSLKSREDINKLAVALVPSFTSGLAFLNEGESLL